MGPGLSAPSAAAAGPLGVTRWVSPASPVPQFPPRDHPCVPAPPAKRAWAFSSEVCNSQTPTPGKKLCAERQNIQRGPGGGRTGAVHAGVCGDFGFAHTCRFGHTRGCAQ